MANILLDCCESAYTVFSSHFALALTFMDRKSKAADLDLHPDFVVTLEDPQVGGVLYERLRNLYHISLTITPLYVLTARQFNNESHGHHHLLAVRLRYRHFLAPD
jgi:hypothetical protein